MSLKTHKYKWFRLSYCVESVNTCNAASRLKFGLGIGRFLAVVRMTKQASRNCWRCPVLSLSVDELRRHLYSTLIQPGTCSLAVVMRLNDAKQVLKLYSKFKPLSKNVFVQHESYLLSVRNMLIDELCLCKLIDHASGISMFMTCKCNACFYTVLS